MIHSILHGLLGYFMENDAMHVLAVQRAAFLEKLNQMPGNGLAFTIGVSREVQCIGFLECTNNGFDVFFIAFDHLVLHLEVVVRVNGAFLGHEVPDMAIRGHDIEVLAKVLADRLRLCGRLDNYEILRHLLRSAPRRGSKNEKPRFLPRLNYRLDGYVSRNSGFRVSESGLMLPQKQGLPCGHKPAPARAG
jgi:hypothetical protein